MVFISEISSHWDSLDHFWVCVVQIAVCVGIRPIWVVWTDFVLTFWKFSWQVRVVWAEFGLSVDKSGVVWTDFVGELEGL